MSATVESLVVITSQRATTYNICEGDIKELVELTLYSPYYIL